MNYRCLECCHLQECSGPCEECGCTTEMIRDLEGQAAQAILGGYLEAMEKEDG